MKIGFLIAGNPKVKGSWSGTHYYMYKALVDGGHDVCPLGPLPDYGLVKLGKGLNRISNKLFGRSFNTNRNPLITTLYTRCITQRVQTSGIDVLFAPAGAHLIADLDINTPICYLSDTSFSQIASYYANYQNLSKRAQRTGEALENKAIQKAASLVYASEWAASYVRQHYPVGQRPVHVTPFGANIDKIPDRSSIFSRKESTVCRLLFLGVTWQRKGGPIAMQALEYLLAKGVQVELTVCGCIPPVTHPNLKVIPFLNKNIPEQNRQFEELLLNTDFLILPTRAEAYGVVFCEAAAYGIPSFTAATGGTTTAVVDGANGFTFDLKEQGSAYGAKILELWNDKTAYLQLRHSARERFERELNWDSWARSMTPIFEYTHKSKQNHASHLSR